MWGMQMMLKNINITQGLPAFHLSTVSRKSVDHQARIEERKPFLYFLGLGLCWPVVLNTALFTFVSIGHFSPLFQMMLVTLNVNVAAAGTTVRLKQHTFCYLSHLKRRCRSETEKASTHLSMTTLSTLSVF